jgi:hypothetical protein
VTRARILLSIPTSDIQTAISTISRGNDDDFYKKFAECLVCFCGLCLDRRAGTSIMTASRLLGNYFTFYFFFLYVVFVYFFLAVYVLFFAAV